MKKIKYGIAIFIFINIIFIAFCNYLVIVKSRGRIYSNINLLPHNKVGLVFGTSKMIKNGSANPFFQNRLKAAAELFHAKKIDYIILSGDNQYTYYNEPKDMRKVLLELNVPDSVLILDYAGFRTFDSVIRCNKVFGQTKFTLISQEFQNKRGLFIAEYKHLDVIAYNAEDVEFKLAIRTFIREIFARVNVVFDIYVLNKQPKFLGLKIDLK